MNADQLKERATACLRSAQERLDHFVSLADSRTADEVACAFDAVRHPINEIEGWIGLYASVHPDPAVRGQAELLEQDLSSWLTDFSQNREAFEALSRHEPEQAKTPEAVRFLEHAMRDFRRSGVDCEEAVRERLRELSKELVVKGQEFDRNIVEDSLSIVIEDGHAGLLGMPEDFLRSHPEDAEGRVLVSTDPQDWIPFMSFAERPDLREALFMRRMQRAFPKNLEILQQILELRHEYATQLGYPSWAAYSCEELMSREAETVREFIERCAELSVDRSDMELVEQLEMKRSLGVPNAGSVNEWDFRYLIEKVKESRYEFDAQSARGYFPYSRVIQGVLDVASALYGVEFHEKQDVELWHDSVRCFEILEEGRAIARFYLDMHPRDGKYKHAAMFPLISGFENGPLPEACLVCNFSAPGPGEPALLLHDQVTTVFHEFGHLLHHLYSNGQQFLRFSGIATEWDFVEVPSQMFEEWAWNPEVLRSFAKHYETGEPIPEVLVQRMKKADECGRGTNARVQTFYASLSLRLHDQDPSKFDLMERMIDLRSSYAPFPHVEGTCLLASFGHLNGYSAIYYTYLWSLVIAKDLFSRFESNLMNPETAEEYRNHILGCGGQEDAAELVRQFLGREYSTEAWEKSLTS